MKIKCIKILAIGALLVLTGCNEINPDNYKKTEPVSVGAEETNVNPENSVAPQETGENPNVESVKNEDTVSQPPQAPTANTVETSEYKDYSAELEKNALGSKPLIVFFTGTGCETCKTLDENIKENLSTLENAIILKADFAGNSELAAKYRVDEVNTVVFVDKDGGSYNKKTGANINDIRNFLNTDR